jgi:hypothetical protein
MNALFGWYSARKSVLLSYKIEVVDVSRIAVENNLIALPAVRKNRANEPAALPSPRLSEPEANRVGTMHKPRRRAERG